jgi:hypothetical protein
MPMIVRHRRPRSSGRGCRKPELQWLLHRRSGQSAHPDKQYLSDFQRLLQVLGKHTMKFGGEFHADQINAHPVAQFNGSFVFSGQETGVDFADFLIGVPASTTRANSTPSTREINPGNPGIPNTLAPLNNHDFAPRVGVAWSPQAESGSVLGNILGPSGNDERAGQRWQLLYRNRRTLDQRAGAIPPMAQPIPVHCRRSLLHLSLQLPLGRTMASAFHIPSPH